MYVQKRKNSLNKLNASILKGILIEQVKAGFSWVSKINKHYEEGGGGRQQYGVRVKEAHKWTLFYT